MHVSRRSLVALLSSAALAGSATTAVTALGHGNHGRHNGNTTFASTLAPAVPAPADPVIHGVAPGNVPWQLDRGAVRLRHGGRFQLSVRGLVIPGNGTPGPVSTISASLYCGADTTAAATTGSVPISRSGDARIDQALTLPTSCLAPVVLVHPNGNAAAYIAASGFSG